MVEEIAEAHVPEPTIKTAAMLVIGNEILSGKTKDKNIGFVAEQLTQHSINLQEVRIIPDKEQTIVEALNRLRQTYDYVVTSGGLGPTHDDITAQSVAKALNLKLIRNGNALRRLKTYYRSDEFNEARRSMADMPRGSVLIDNPVTIAPGFKIENIFVLAGVPVILQAMMDHVLMMIEGGTKHVVKTITCTLREGQVAEDLTKIQNKYSNFNVEIGSYAFFRNGMHGVSIVSKAYDEMALQRTIRDIRAMIKRHNGTIDTEEEHIT